MTTPRPIFVGGYSKSGTTFLGRALGIFNGVVSRGEQDYFRIFFSTLNKLGSEFNTNIKTVNAEVYDGRGDITPLTEDSMRSLHQKMFHHLFWNGADIPDDCRFFVEKSPHNIFWIKQINLVFPGAVHVATFRNPHHVYRSFMRHMADHREKRFQDAAFTDRIDSMDHFVGRWNRMIDMIEQHRSKILLINYESLAADVRAFLDFAQTRIFGEQLELTAPIESLSKEAYLKTLPAAARAKSLVQTGPYKISLSDAEIARIDAECKLPAFTFDF